MGRPAVATLSRIACCQPLVVGLSVWPQPRPLVEDREAPSLDGLLPSRDSGAEADGTSMLAAHETLVDGRYSRTSELLDTEAEGDQLPVHGDGSTAL